MGDVVELRRWQIVGRGNRRKHMEGNARATENVSPRSAAGSIQGQAYARSIGCRGMILDDILFHPNECVRLIAADEFPEEWGTIVGDAVHRDDMMALILVYPPFRQGVDDNGLRDAPVAHIRKQYEDC
jgi:hypothetical protein